MKGPIRSLSVTYLVLEKDERTVVTGASNPNDPEGPARTLVVTYLVLQNDERESLSPAHAGTDLNEEQSFLPLINEILAPSSMILRKQSFGLMILSKA